MAIPSQSSDLLSRYFHAKLQVGEWTGASQELLHVHAGLAIFLLASLLLRRKFRSPVPLALVIVLAVANEVIDWLNHPPTTTFEPLWDVLNTVFWPGLLFLLARRWK